MDREGSGNAWRLDRGPGPADAGDRRRGISQGAESPRRGAEAGTGLGPAAAILLCGLLILGCGLWGFGLRRFGLRLDAAHAELHQELSPAFIAARCQINDGPWQPCRMVIRSIGLHWWLLIGGRRFEFRHDGQGIVTVGEGHRPPRPVTPRWRSQGVLCWDGLCVEGPIPLD